MGEEAKQEQATEETKPQEMAEGVPNNEEPKAPSPFVLYVDLHCVGCAKKIEKSIMRIRGVEGVKIDMGKNQVTIKGVVEPAAVCSKIMKKTKRRAKVLSPLPASEGEPIPEVVNSQVSGLTTVELNVNMHCEACAEQLKRKILKMRGVRTAATELSSGKVTVTGTMDGNKLVEYVYRRTKKQAKIVPQPDPQPENHQPSEPKPEENNPPPPPAPPQEDPQPEEKKEEPPASNNEGGAPPPEEQNNAAASGGETSDGANENGANSGSGVEEKGEGGGGGGGNVETGEVVRIIDHQEQSMQKMMYHYHPLYVIERIPPPQLFSDENPNACSIS